MEKTFKSIATNYGLYLGGISILVLAIMYALSLEKSWAISGASVVLTILIFFYGIKSFKSFNEGYLTLGEAIKMGLAIAAIGGVIGAIYTYIHYSFIYPEFIENIRSQSLNQMLQSNPEITDEQIEKATQMTNIFSSPFSLATFSLIGNLVFGIIASLIIGLIIKKGKE